MKRIGWFIVLFAIVCYSMGVLANEELFLDLDYDVVKDTYKEVRGVAIQRIEGVYRLKYLGSGEQTFEQVVVDSTDPLVDPQIEIDEQHQVITYVKASQGVYELFLLSQNNGNWVTVNQGNRVNNRTSPLQVVDLLLKDEFIYVAYLQDQRLQVIQYNLKNGTLSTRYQQSLAGRNISEFAFEKIGADLVVAELEQVKDQTELHLLRVLPNGQIEEIDTVEDVNGFDLQVVDSKLYYVYDQKVEQASHSQIFLMEESQGMVQQVGGMTRQGQGPGAVKLLVANGQVKILYRAQGIRQPFDLFVTPYRNGRLTDSVYLPVDGYQALLDDLRVNIYEVDEATLLVGSPEQNHFKQNFTEGLYALDLAQGIPQEVWQAGLSKGHVRRTLLKQSVDQKIYNSNLVNPTGMVTDSDQNIYILDSIGVLKKFDSLGQFVSQWYLAGTDEEVNFSDILLDSEGFFSVVDSLNHRILRINSEGEIVQSWGSKGSKPGEFLYPTAIAIDQDDNIYVVDGGNHRVQKFDSLQNYLTEWGGFGTGSGQFNHPKGIAIDEQNHLYIADTGNHRVQVFTSDGTYMKQLGTWGTDASQMIWPVDVAVSSGQLFVADRGNDRIQAFDSNFTYLYELGSRGGDWGHFKQINNLFIDHSGNIFVTDQENHMAQKISTDYNVTLGWHGGEPFIYEDVLEILGVGGGDDYYWNVQSQSLLQLTSDMVLSKVISLEGQKDRIFRGFTADESYFYFTDLLHDQIVVYTHEGNLVRVIGQSGQSQGELNSPLGIAVDLKGMIYVADSGNHRVQKFTSTGAFVQEWGGFGLGDGELVTPLSITCQDDQVLVADLGLLRVQAFTTEGEAVESWPGIGNKPDQIFWRDYLKGDLESKANQTMQVDYGTGFSFGLANDYIPKKVKTWEWDRRWGFIYRSTANQSAIAIPDGSFSMDHTRRTIFGGTGRYYLHIQAVDLFGGISGTGSVTHTGHFSAILDNEDPTMTLPEPTSVPEKAVNLAWTGSDLDVPRNKIRYKHKITNIHPDNWSTTELDEWNNVLQFDDTTSIVKDSGNGEKYLVVQARDQAGNTSDLYVTSFVLDNQPPTISYPTKEVTADQRLQITFHGQDNISNTGTLKYRYVLDKNAETDPMGIYEAENVFVEEYQSGTVYIHVQVQDEAGNSSQTAHYTFDLADITPPTITGLADQIVPKQSWTWNWDGSDNESAHSEISFRYHVDPYIDGSLDEFEFGSDRQTSVANLPDGLYYLNIQAKDKAENYTDIQHYAVTIDTTDPTLTESEIVYTGTLANPTQNMYRSTVTVEIPESACLDANGIGKIEYQMDRGGYIRYTNPFVIQTDGTHSIDIRLTDRAGNSSTYTLNSIKIDTTPPELVLPDVNSMEERWFNQGQDVVISVADHFAGLESIEYNLNHTGWFGLTNGDEVTVAEEGENQLQVRMTDKVGNQQIVMIPVQIDYTSPTIATISSSTHPRGSWTYHRTGAVEVESDPDLSGIREYYYQINSEPDYVPYQENDYQVSLENIIPVQELADGIHYLHLQPVDQAGNVGVVRHYKMKVVDETPTTPVIQSDTHTQNAGSLYQKAHFFWDTPVAGDQSVVGVIEYEYKLEKIINDQGETIEEGTTSLNEVILDHLAVLSMESGDYYRFSLQAINAAGRRSPEAEFIFHVEDRSQIEEIFVLSETHPDINKYYNNPNAFYYWVYPDWMNIGDLSYKFGLESEFAQKEWLPVTGQEGAFPIVEPVSETYNFQVKGDHGAEIITSNLQTINLDLENPTISNFEVSFDELLRQVTVYWGNASDSGDAGLAQIRMHLFSEQTDGTTIEDRGWFRGGRFDRQKTIEFLESGVDYTLELEVLDQAGNRCLKAAKFNLLTGVEYSVGQSLVRNIANWQVAGNSYDGVVQKAEILIAKDFQFNILQTDGSYQLVEKIPLATGTLIGDYGFIGANDQIQYTVNLSGYTFSGQGLYIDATGFYLKKIWMNAPEAFWYDSLGQEVPENQVIAFEDVQLAALSGNQVQGTYQDVKTDCNYFNNWFYDLAEIRLDQTSLRALGTVDLISAYVERPLPVEVTLHHDLSFTPITLPVNYELALPGGSVLQVKDSELTSDYLWVKEAEFSIDLNGQVTTTHLGNFTIDYYGTIEQLENYYSEAVTFNYGGVTYTVGANEIGFEGNGLYILNGTGTVPGSDEVLPIAFVPIDNQGEVLLPGENYFTSIEKTVLGFTIRGSRGTQVGDQIVFEQGTIDLPIMDGYGRDVTIELRDLPYGAKGFDLAQAEIYTPYFNYNQLGIIEITGFDFDETGLVVDGKVQLGSNLPRGLRYRTFSLKQFTITADKGITSSLVANVPSGEPITIYDTLQFSTTELIFRDEPDMKSIYFNQGTLLLIGAVGTRLNLPAVNVNFVEIDHLGDLRQFDTDLSTESFLLRGVDVTAYSLDVDPDYIHFVGKVTLPMMTDLEMPIYSLKLNHETGTVEEFYISGDGPLAFDFFGWDMEIYSIKIMETSFGVQAALEIPEVMSQLLPGISGRFMEVDELVMGNDGAVEKLNLMVPYRDEIPVGGGLTLIVKDPGVLLENPPTDNFGFGLSFAQAGLILPEGLGGGILTVDQLSFDNQGNLDYDQIRLQKQQIPFFDLAMIEVTDATFTNDQVSIEGTVTLGDSFPGSFAGKEFTIDDLIINGEGVQTFTVATDLAEPLNLFDAMQFTADEISISESKIELTGGEVKFIGDLAERISSTSVQLNTFSYNYKTGEIEAFNAEFADLNFQLFDCAVDVSTLEFDTNYIRVNGTVTLPSAMPGTLSGKEVAIDTLEIYYNGEVKDYRVAVEDAFNFDLNGLLVNFDEIAIDATGFEMDATATLSRSSMIPESLRGTEVVIDNFKINTNYEVVDFTVYIDKMATFLIGETQFDIDRLAFTKTKFRMAGAVQLPSSYPGTLANQQINFHSFEMDYHGNLIASDISISQVDFALGSFLDAKIYDLAFTVNEGDLAVGASKVEVELGDLGKAVTFDQVNIDKDGNFSADVEVNLDLQIAGVSLQIIDPTLVDGGIQASSASILLPEELGGNGLAVNDVVIDPDLGLRIDGGTFKINFPEIKIGDVGFQNTFMELKMVDGTYRFEGNGEAQIPGIGLLAANVKLRSVSPVYQTGIERIFLSFESTGRGLPLGATGLYINGVEGEFADGPFPADTVTAVTRIGEDMRFSLGVSIRDLSGGLTGDTGFWVNIVNGNSAVVGEVSLLSDLFSARVSASITEHFSDFYADAQIIVTPIEGNVGFRMWAANGGTNLAGWGDVRVSVTRGQVFYKTWHYWGFGWHTAVIAIPSSTWKSPSVGVEFGKFKNNAKGVKGYIDVPLFGDIGFFAGTPNFKLGGLSEYVLIGKDEISFIPLKYDPTLMSLMSALQSQEVGNYSVGETEYVGFVLPGYRKRTFDGATLMEAEPTELREYYVQSTQRLVFAVGFDLGDPQIVAIGSDGRRYTQDTPGVEYLKEASQVMISVPNPDPGAWYLELEDVQGIHYQVAILGSTPEPELLLAEPVINEQGQVVISGRGGVFTGDQTYVDLYYDTDDHNPDGRLIAERIPLTDHMFSYQWDAGDLASGKYYIYGKVYDNGEMPPVISYAEQGIDLVNYQPILPPTQVRVIKNQDQVEVSWEIAKNPNVVGFKVYYGQESGVYDASLDVGYLSHATLPVIEGERCYVTVVSYNEEDAESVYAPEAAVSLVEQEVDQFNLADLVLPESVPLYIGEGQLVTVPYLVTGLPTGDEGQYFTVEFAGLPEGVSADVDQPFYNLYAEEQEMNVHFFAEAEAGEEAGQTAVTMICRSAANPELVIEKELNLTLAYRQPVIWEVTPGEGINNQAREIRLKGDHFRDGAQVYLGENLVDLVSVDRYEIRGNVDVGVGPGLYDVKVVNDDQQFAEMTAAYTVLQPDFTLEPLQEVVVPLGAESEIYLQVAGWNEFTGQVTVQPGVVPDGFWIDQTVKTVTAGEEVAFLIGAGYDLIPGEYQLSFTGLSGKLIDSVEVTVRVVDEEVTPEIQGFNKPFAIPGEPMRLYGMGLGLSGNLYLNGQLIPVSEWRTNRIEFTVPEGASTGMVQVEAGGKLSESVELLVKEKKYSVSLSQERVLVNQGEEVMVNFAITGFSDPIDFSLENVPDGVSYQFVNAATDVEPNYTLKCQLVTTPEMKLGEYQIDLVGQVGDARKMKSFTLQVADLPELENDLLAEGRVGVKYQEWVDVKGGFAPYQFQVLNHSLPAGLELTRDGQITGVPEEAGSYQVTVKVTDQVNQVDEREMLLNVMTNEWIYPGYDSRGSNWTADQGPAAEDVGFEIRSNGGSDLLLTSEKSVIAIGQENVYFYDKLDGSLVGSFTMPDEIVDAFVMKDRLVLLDQSGNVDQYTWTPAEPVIGTMGIVTGGLIEVGDGKEPGGSQGSGDTSSDQEGSGNLQGHLYLYRDQVIEIGVDQIFFRDQETLTMEETVRLSDSYETGVKGVLQGQILYYLTDQQQIVGFDLEERRNLFTTSFESRITNLVGVVDGVLVVQENGDVSRVLDDGTVEFVLTSRNGIEDLIPYADGYLVGDGTGFGVFNSQGRVTHELTLDYSDLIVAGNRLYLTTAEAVQCYKLSDLSQVWSYKVMNGQSLVVSEEQLYALTDSALYKFDAATNVHAPVSSTLTKPKVPNGDHDYFLEDVTLYIESTDQDNEVMVTYYAVDGGEFAVYHQGVQLGEGEHTIQFYGMDEELKLEDVQERRVKVDCTPPGITLVSDPVDGLNGYYTASIVHVALEAVDLVSGVDTLYYQIDDGEEQVYTGAFTVEGEGEHVIKYHGRDLAGNETEVFTHSFRLDATPPVTTVESTKSIAQGLAVNIRFAVTDNYSGFATIHYQVDAGPILTTQDEIYLITPGEHVVTYYAEDLAGNVEAAHELIQGVKSPEEIDWVENVELTEFHNALTREQEYEMDRKVEVGDLIYLDESYLFEELPEYLVGSRLIRTKRHANQTGYHDYYLRFDTTIPAKVYVVVENAVGELAGFTKIGETKFASRKHFSQMQSVYMRQVSGATTIQIPSSQLVDQGHAPLVFVEYDDSWIQGLCQ